MAKVDPKISIVVPVYKEERNIGPFLALLEPVLERIEGSYEILFCLDPSPDRTEQVIAEHIERNSRIRPVVFSRRFGQPAATMGGIFDVTRRELCCHRCRPSRSTRADRRDVCEA